MRLRKSSISVVGLVLATATAFGQSVVESVRSAEQRENLKTCLAGSFPSLCKHELLNGAERTQVAAAERRENLKTCLAGSFPSLCRHELLSSSERTDVAAAEQRENLKTCLAGSYPSLCRHDLEIG